MRKGLVSLILVAGLILPSSALAQEAKKNVVYQWNDFSGGLNTKLSDFGLPKKHSTISENIRYDTSLNSISKRNNLLLYGTADTTEAITGMHRLYLVDGTKVLLVTHGDEIEKGSDTANTFTTILDLTTGDNKWQFLTWHNIGIGGDGYNQPIKYDGSSAAATYLGSCLGTDAGSGAGPDGTYSYKISYYTASYEVLFNQVSNSVTVVDNDIDLTMIPIAPDTYGGEDVVGRKVYRNTVAAPAVWDLLSNGTIANNTATTLTDSDADGAVGAAYPAGDATYTPPKGRFYLINNNRLFIANNPTFPSRIWYSESGSHDVFVTDNYFNIRPDDGDQITFIKNLLGLLTISKDNTIQKLYTDGATPSSDWEIGDPLSFTGCAAPYSAVNTPLGILYLAKDGIYKFTGQYSILMSDRVTPIIRNISSSNFSSVWGEYHKNIYYIAYTDGSGGASSNDRVMAYDVLVDAYTTDIMSINAFCTFNSGSDWDTLYSGASDSGKVYANETTTDELIHRSHSDFAGTFDYARYLPTAVGGESDNPILETAWYPATLGNWANWGASFVDLGYGTLAHPGATGSYISQSLLLNASNLIKIYWNEQKTTADGASMDVTFQLRDGSTPVAPEYALWTSGYTDPSGSDISGATPNTYIQYKINFNSNTATYTPTLVKLNNYVVRMTYSRVGTSAETTIPLKWEGGFDDFGYPGYIKTLRKIYVYYESAETGTLDLTFINLEGDTDVFSIDLNTYPSSYVDYFTNGAFLGEFIKLTIEEDSLNDITIKRIICVTDIEPLI